MYTRAHYYLIMAHLEDVLTFGAVSTSTSEQLCGCGACGDGATTDGRHCGGRVFQRLLQLSQLLLDVVKTLYFPSLFRAL